MSTSDKINAKIARKLRSYIRRRHQNFIYTGLRDVNNLVQASVYDIIIDF